MDSLFENFRVTAIKIAGYPFIEPIAWSPRPHLDSVLGQAVNGALSVNQ